MAVKKVDLGFRTWREKHDRVHSVCGDPIRTLYSGKYDDDGRLVLEEVGKENIYDYIQSYEESVDINNLIRRYAQGDVDCIERAQGFYFDCTQLPDNMPELLNKFNEAEYGFYQMPVEFREKYGNDFQQFLCQFDPNEFVTVMNEPVEKVVEKNVEKEVKNEQEQ